MTHATVHPRARTLLPTAVALVLLGAGSWGLPQAGMFLVVRQAVATPEVILSLGSHEWERLPVAAGIAAREPAASVLLTFGHNKARPPSNDNVGLRRKPVDHHQSFVAQHHLRSRTF
jgi:hypothetical protein